MNKMLTVSLIAVLGVAGGGAYMYMNPEKNYSQYIPGPVSDLLSEYVPGFSELNVNAEASKPTSTMIVEEYAQPAEEPYVDQQADQQADQQVVVEATQQTIQAEPQVVPVKEQEKQNTVKEQLLPNSDDAVISNAMDEIQQSINEVSEEEVSAEKIAENNKSNNVNPQAVSLKNKINKLTSEISKIDIENNQLEQKFQKVLRKNRELANQLKKIDEKLATNN